MNIKLKLTEETMPLAQLDTLIKILAHQKATISILCDKYTNSNEESDELFENVMRGADEYYQQVYEHIFAKYSSVNPDDFLPNK
ncbi:MAG: hypothetical protein KG003_14300 [Bacteroidetes bacterium]|nr:hypothetical protein [Bacteroidota bacterium]